MWWVVVENLSNNLGKANYVVPRCPEMATIHWFSIQAGVVFNSYLYQLDTFSYIVLEESIRLK